MEYDGATTHFNECIMDYAEARERIFQIAFRYAIDLSLEDLYALTYGAEALKTLEDMKGDTHED